MTNILDNIHVGEFLFEFESHIQWINKAAGWYENHGADSRRTIAVDNLGRICYRGKHFAQADDDNAYPIRVYWNRPEQ